MSCDIFEPQMLCLKKYIGSIILFFLTIFNYVLGYSHQEQ